MLLITFYFFSILRPDLINPNILDGKKYALLSDLRRPNIFEIALVALGKL